MIQEGTIRTELIQMITSASGAMPAMVRARNSAMTRNLEEWQNWSV